MADEKKRQQAVALKYEANKGAPRVAAKGKGVLAEKIIELAKANNIPVREDPDLVELLSRVELGQDIPEELYKAVAEILAFVYRINDKWKKDHGMKEK